MSDPVASRAWRKSSYSGAGDCVEWSFDGSHVRVRDSKDPDGAVLTFTRPEWKAFVAGARDGEADLPASGR